MKKMKKTAVLCAVLAASMGFGSVSFAQGERDHGRDRHEGPPQRHEQRDERRDERGGHQEFHYGARGPEWRRGGHIPREYRNREYVVNDWHAHHLSRPPRGYQWVQVGGDYVLVAIATGIIAQLILNSR